MKFNAFLTGILLCLTGFGSLLSASPLPDLPPAEIQPTVEDNAETTRHTGKAILLSIPGSGESGFHSRDHLPNSSSEEHSSGDDLHFLASDFTPKEYNFYSLDFSKLIDCSQTLKVLLFPFHSFL